MTVRAKMRLSSTTEIHYGAATPARKLRFDAIYDPNGSAEDIAFTKATPSGFVEMQIDNPAALAQFRLGEQYYVDFSPVDPPAQG